MFSTTASIEVASSEDINLILWAYHLNLRYIDRQTRQTELYLSPKVNSTALQLNNHASTQEAIAHNKYCIRQCKCKIEIELKKKKIVCVIFCKMTHTQYYAATPENAAAQDTEESKQARTDHNILFQSNNDASPL